MSKTNQQILLAEVPADKLTVQHFKQITGKCPQPAAGEVLCKTRYLSLDPANRSWMQGATYRSAVKAGDIMAGGGIAEVVESRSPDFKPGDLVSAESGWQEYFCARAENLQKREPYEPLSYLLSALGVTSLTAYCGMLDIGKPQPGETVVVSAAAGATGSVAGQIAKIKGARVVGIAGGSKKCAWLRDELGFDEVIDYKSENVYKSLKERCPDGVDVYFDNVGGTILEAVLARMNLHGRIVCCGAVSQYDGGKPQAGPAGVPGILIIRRIRMEGFIVFDYVDMMEQGNRDLRQWLVEGKLKVAEDILEGLESAPAGLVGLLAGDNIGKRMVRVA